MTRFLLLLIFIGANSLLQAQVKTRPVVTASEIPTYRNATLDKTFSKFRTIDLHTRTLFQQVNAEDFDNEITWKLGDQTFNLFIYKHDMRAEDYILQLQTDTGLVIMTKDELPSYTYRGYNMDDPALQVRLSITPDAVSGLIQGTDGHEHYIQPVRDFDRTARDVSIVYRPEDVINDHNTSCASTAVHDKSPSPSNNTNESSRSATCKEVQVAIAADYSMYTKYGSNATNLANHLQDLKNLMEPNYSPFDLEFKVVTTFIDMTSNAAPWTSSTDANELLESMGCWAGTGNGGSQFGNCTGQNGFNSVEHDIGELWTNRYVNGQQYGTIGLAWIGTVCYNFYKYSINQHYSSDLESLRVLIAHESGHNFGADHYTGAGENIMEPSVDPAAESFSANSQGDINAKLGGYTCLESITCGSGSNCPPTVMVTSGNATGTVEAGDDIMSSGTININSTTVYDAPTVQINSNFTVANGLVFEIKSDGCN